MNEPTMSKEDAVKTICEVLKNNPNLIEALEALCGAEEEEDKSPKSFKEQRRLVMEKGV